MDAFINTVLNVVIGLFQLSLLPVAHAVVAAANRWWIGSDGGAITIVILLLLLLLIVTRSSATAEIARDADDVDFSADDVHGALALAFNSFNIHLYSP